MPKLEQQPELEATIFDAYRKIADLETLAATEVDFGLIPVEELRSASQLLTDLAEVVAGQTVTVEAVEDKPYSAYDSYDEYKRDQLIISEMGWDSWLGGMNVYRSRRQVQGTIARFSPEAMILAPKRLSTARANHGHFEVPILGTRGEELVRITPRLRTWRDKRLR